MNLTWKDAITTIIAACIILIALAQVRGWNIPVIDNPRWAAFLVVLLGLLMCVVGAGTVPEMAGVYVSFMTILAGFSVLMGVMGMIFGTPLLVVGTASVVVVMWIVSTVRHLL